MTEPRAEGAAVSFYQYSVTTAEPLALTRTMLKVPSLYNWPVQIRGLATYCNIFHRSIEMGKNGRCNDEDTLTMNQVRDPRQPDNIDVEVGRRVRVERIARGLSQTELGDRIGVTFQQVQKYESGANRISMGRLTRIGRVFGLDATYLLGASKRRTPTAEPNSKAQAKLSEAMRMLGRIGALRMLKAFVAIPPKPAGLRESIVQMVEGAAAAGRVREERKRPKRR